MKHNYIFLAGYLSKKDNPFTTFATKEFAITFSICSDGIECLCCAYGDIAKKIYTTDLNTKVVAEGCVTQIKKKKYFYISKIEIYTKQKVINPKNLKIDYLEEIILNNKNNEKRKK